jgi:hypothetical protein
MITRGYVLVSRPLDNVHDAVLETCKEMKAKVKDAKSNSDIGYQIEVETASRFGAGQSLQIRLQEEKKFHYRKEATTPTAARNIKNKTGAITLAEIVAPRYTSMTHTYPKTANTSH